MPDLQACRSGPRPVSPRRPCLNGARPSGQSSRARAWRRRGRPEQGHFSPSGVQQRGQHFHVLAVMGSPTVSLGRSDKYAEPAPCDDPLLSGRAHRKGDAARSADEAPAQLQSLSANVRVKVDLARRLRRETTVSLKWIAQPPPSPAAAPAGGRPRVGRKPSKNRQNFPLAPRVKGEYTDFWIGWGRANGGGTPLFLRDGLKMGCWFSRSADTYR